MNRDLLVFLLKPNSKGDRDFVTGVVVADDELLTVRFDPDPQVATGTKVAIFYREDERFMRQHFTVTRILMDEAAGVRHEMRAEGEAVEDGERQSERVPAVFESMLATFGREKDCVVLDVSEQGISLIAGAQHKVSETMKMELWIKSTRYSGSVTIRSVAPMRRNRFRYGLECEPDGTEQNLAASIRQFWIALQIKHLELLGPEPLSED